MERSRMVDKYRMKRTNMRLVFDEIYEHQLVSRPKLARSTGLSVMSIGRMAEDLINLGLICEADAREEPGQGRPAKHLAVRSEGMFCLGVSLEKSGMRIGAVSPYGRVAQSAQVPFGAHLGDPQALVALIVQSIREFEATCRVPLLPLLGVTLPGMIDPVKGHVRFSSQFAWHDVPLQALLCEALGEQRVVVDNDLKAWALAEKRFGQTHGYDNSVLLNIGSGIGAAAVIDGVVYRGSDNSAGEIGHIAIQSNTRMCECGRLGCLQTNLTDWAIEQEIRIVEPDASLDALFAGYRRGVPWAKALMERSVSYARLAISLLVNAYAPGVVVLCGSLLASYPQFAERIVADYESHLADFPQGEPPIAISSLGLEGGMIGAAAVAFEQTLKQLIG